MLCVCVSVVKSEEEHSGGGQQVKLERVKSESGSSSSSSSDGDNSSSEEEEVEEEDNEEEGDEYEPDLDLENDFPLGNLHMHSLLAKFAVIASAPAHYISHILHTPGLSLPCVVAMELSVTLTVAAETLCHLAKRCCIMAAIVVVVVWRGGFSGYSHLLLRFHGWLFIGLQSSVDF